MSTYPNQSSTPVESQETEILLEGAPNHFLIQTEKKFTKENARELLAQVHAVVQERYLGSNEGYIINKSGTVQRMACPLRCYLYPNTHNRFEWAQIKNHLLNWGSVIIEFADGPKYFFICNTQVADFLGMYITKPRNIENWDPLCMEIYF